MQVVFFFLLATLPLSRLAAQPNPWLEVDGRTIRDVNPDDARLLAIVVRGMVNSYEKKNGSLPNDLRTLLSAATLAYGARNWNKAWRLGVRLAILLREEPLSADTEVAASLDVQLDRRIAGPGEPITVRLAPLFVPAAQPGGGYRIRLQLRDGEGRVHQTLGPEELPQLAEKSITLQAVPRKAGRYFVDFQLLKDEKTLTEASRDFLVEPSLKPRLAALQEKISRINAGDVIVVYRKAAVETVEYIASLLDRMTREYAADVHKTAHPMMVKLRGPRFTGYAGDIIHLPRDLEFAEELAAGLLAGKNPLAARAGDMRMAQLSAVDATLQPFRVFVPRGFDPGKQYPLIVALHGASGDENTYMDRYLTPEGKNMFQALAQERGYLLVTPNGRGPYGMYLENSERDVMETLDRVMALYPVAAGQVFLTGHSMGGGGAWHLGFSQPKRFRALAPVASGFGGRIPGAPSVPLRAAPEMPVLFCYGMRDILATPENSRRLAEYATKQLKNFEAKEFPGDHFEVGLTSMHAVFDFFDRFRPKEK